MAQPLKISLPSSAWCAALCRRSSCPPCRGSLQPTEASPSPSTSRSPPLPPPPSSPRSRFRLQSSDQLKWENSFAAVVTIAEALPPSHAPTHSSLGPPPILSWTVVAASIGSRSAKLPGCPLPHSHSRPSSSTLITPGRLTHSRKFVE